MDFCTTIRFDPRLRAFAVNAGKNNLFAVTVAPKPRSKVLAVLFSQWRFWILAIIAED